MKSIVEHGGVAVEPGVPVLVVDDEETIRSLLSLVVTRAGGRPVLAETAGRARELVDGAAFDVALVDKNLPDGNGIQLLAHIRERHPHTQVLIVTGYANTDSAIEALRLGAFDYIVKPFDVAGVTHRIKLALERQRMQRELKVVHATLAESREEVKRAYLETVLRLSRAAELSDEGAEPHIARISRYAGMLARALDATDDWIEQVTFAAPLHDIGKIGVPSEILRKPGPLTAEERIEVARHVEIGARILAGTTSTVLSLAREIVLTHHERWDGTGYPTGLRGDAIPLAGRIVAVIDAWDAVSTDRVYRKALPDEEAIDEIRRGSGTKYDPQVIDAFDACLAQILAVKNDR